MNTYHIGFAYDTEYDQDFIDILEAGASAAGLGSYRVNTWNLEETYSLIQDRSLNFLSYYDRASDTSPNFYKLYRLLEKRNAFILQLLKKQELAADKALMHRQFQKAHIPVPRTIVLEKPADGSDCRIVDHDLKHFKRPFVVKPAVNTGASSGVNLNAFTVQDIHQTCRFGGDFKYLVQQKINEKQTEKRKFWFRVFYVCGTVYSCWWDPQTHRYEEVTDRQIGLYHLQPLADMIKKIADNCELQFFSTELACDSTDRFYAIDYVNEICDMRLQSKNFDGVPDDLVRKIASSIINYIKLNLNYSTRLFE